MTEGKISEIEVVCVVIRFITNVINADIILHCPSRFEMNEYVDMAKLVSYCGTT